MKRNVLWLLALLLAWGSLHAKAVPEQQAQQAGETFMRSKMELPPSSNRSQALQLVERVNMQLEIGETPTTLFYIFDAGPSGYVIVAGDDQARPILAYSTQSTFNPDPAQMAPAVRKWLDQYKVAMREVIEQDLPSTEHISQQWHELVQGTYDAGVQGTEAVQPLMATQWNQAPYYNDACPIDPASGQRSVAGCVATAMAQIMKFWSFPATGTGFHSYNHNRLGTLSANFGSANYDWAAMPNVANGPNQALALMTYHVGVSVEMDYSSDVSGAYVVTNASPVQHCSEYALKTYFRYDPSLQGVIRN